MPAFDNDERTAMLTSSPKLELIKDVSLVTGSKLKLLNTMLLLCEFGPDVRTEIDYTDT